MDTLDIRHAQQGFTLIEMLVTLLLMALLSVLAWRGLDAVDQTRSRLDATNDDVLAILRTLGQMERDLSRSVAPPRLSQAPATPGAAPRLDIIRASATQPGAWQQVRWSLEGDALKRAVSPASTHLPLPEPAQAVTVLSPVSRMDIKRWVDGQGWQTMSAAAPTEADTVALPPGLEVSLERPHQGQPERYRKVILLP